MFKPTVLMRKRRAAPSFLTPLGGRNVARRFLGALFTALAAALTASLPAQAQSAKDF